MKFFALCLLVLSYGCNNSTGNITKPPKKDNGGNELEETVVNELIKDQNFQRGLKVTPLSTKIVREGGGFDKTYVDTLGFGNDGAQPVWQLAQWGSDYSLEDIQYEEGVGGSKVYKNSGKRVVLYPDSSLLLEVNASQEYDKPRKQGEQWPHLLISQNFPTSGPNVGQAKELNFSMQLKLVYAENKMAEQAYDPGLHTAHTPFYFIIKNKNKNSPNYNEMIWFGIRSYDYRHPVLSNEAKISWDKATEKYIYQVPPTAIWGNISLHDEKWHMADADLKPLILESLDILQEKGVFKATSPNDLQIMGMNFGWEVPGTFDAAVRVKDVSLEVVTSKEV